MKKVRGRFVRFWQSCSEISSFGQKWAKIEILKEKLPKLIGSAKDTYQSDRTDKGNTMKKVWRRFDENCRKFSRKSTFWPKMKLFLEFAQGFGAKTCFSGREFWKEYERKKANK